MKVIAFGKFDSLHPGHLYYLEIAKFKNAELYVGVHEESNIPIHDRLKLVNALRIVDGVFAYSNNYQEMVEKIGANFVVLGEEHRGKERFNEIKVPIIYVPRHKGYSSTDLAKQKLGWREIWGPKSDDYDWDYEGIADYIAREFGVNSNILDFGCGTGQLLEYMVYPKLGIDISEKALDKAISRNPFGIDVSTSINGIQGHFSLIVSVGTFQYLDSLEDADYIIKKMKKLSDKIIILGIPDHYCKIEREERREHKNPQHLYFTQQWWIDRGFKLITHNEYPTCTNNQEFEFGAVYQK